VTPLSASDIKVGKKKRTVKFPCLLCEGDHYSHLFPRMDEASYLLEKIQLPTGYRNISPKPSLVDGLVNLVPSLVSLVDQVVNLVSSSVEPQTQVVDPVLSSINPTLHLKSETQVMMIISLSSVIPLLLEECQSGRSSSIIDRSHSSLKSAKVVDLVPPSVDPTPPLKSETKVVDLVPPPVDPTPHSKSEDVAQVYLINTDSPDKGALRPSRWHPLQAIK
jgi:hypothetical protein